VGLNFILIFQARDNNNRKFNWNLNSGWKFNFVRIIWSSNFDDISGNHITKSSRNNVDNVRNDFNVGNIQNDFELSGLEVQSNRFSIQSRDPEMQVKIPKQFSSFLHKNVPHISSHFEILKSFSY